MDKILEIFLNDSESEFHVRGISKKLRISPTTVSKYLKKLKEEKILLSEERFNHLLFKANTKNRIFIQKKINYNLENLFKSGIISYINENLYPNAIVLFGSYSRGENNLNSDIDLLVIGASKKEIKLENFEKKLGHKIQLFIYKKEELEKMAEKNKELVNSWINGIVLDGFFEVLR